MTSVRKDPSNNILKTDQFTKNTVDSLLGRSIKFRPSRYIDEKLELFKRKFAPVNNHPNNNNSNNDNRRPTTASYGHQQQYSVNQDATEETVDAYNFEKPSKFLFARDRLESSWTTIRPIGAGLTDVGGKNSALNAVLQCLTYTPLLFNYLCSKWHSSNCTVQDYCMVCALEDHMKECMSNPGQRIAPRQFIGKLKKMKKGSSEDAYDIWSFFIEQMQHFLLLEKGSEDKRIQETTALYQIYNGHMQERAECTSCQEASIEYQYHGFLNLSLDINQGSTLERCLTRHLQSLSSSPANECKSCKQSGTVKKSHTIYQPPRVLVIHLKRFDKNGSKNEKSIKFEETLDITRLLTPTVGPTESKYQLCGLITHQGGSSIHAGRFVPCVRNSNGMWYCLDNEAVQQINAKRLSSQQPYMLFYRQQTKEAPRIKSTSAPRPSVLLDTMGENDGVNQLSTEVLEKDEASEDMSRHHDGTDDNGEEDEEKRMLAKAMEEAKLKPKVENATAIVVRHDDKMESKRDKLQALIEKEAAQGKSQLAKEQLLSKTPSSQFSTSVERWDAEEQEDTGTSMTKEQGRKALLQQMKTKRKKTDMYDMEYDRGKLKKVKQKKQDKFGKPNMFQITADQKSLQKKKK